MGTHGVEKEKKNAFKKIKRAPTNAPALDLLDVMMPFFLYECGRLGRAEGFFSQLLVS
jgi:hypothetical protein